MGHGMQGCLPLHGMQWCLPLHGMQWCLPLHAMVPAYSSLCMVPAYYSLSTPHMPHMPHMHLRLRVPCTQMHSLTPAGVTEREIEREKYTCSHILKAEQVPSGLKTGAAVWCRVYVVLPRQSMLSYHARVCSPTTPEGHCLSLGARKKPANGQEAEGRQTPLCASFFKIGIAGGLGLANVGVW